MHLFIKRPNKKYIYKVSYKTTSLGAQKRKSFTKILLKGVDNYFEDF